MLKEMLENVGLRTPLIHNITNYVTVNDCANILIACGASPIMSDELAEVEEITTICNALNINIGTLNSHTIPSMLAAGKKARSLSHHVLLDPVGAGASKLRTDTALRILDEVKPSAVRGNISEIKALAMGEGSTKGVDADVADTVTDDTLEQSIGFVKSFAAKTGAVVAVTGAIDIVTDGNRTFVIRNGHPMLSRITGSGCMLSAMTAAYLAANPETPLEATAAAVCAMGLCGEKAQERLTDCDGNSTFRDYLIDEIYNLSGDALEAGAKYELR